MAKNNSRKYQFNENLIAISVADNIEEVLKEWRLLTAPIKDRKKKVCICNHTVWAEKHIIINIKNHKCAFVGSACKNKFGKKIGGKKGNKTNQLLQDFMNNEYDKITNLEAYCFEVEQYLIKYLTFHFDPQALEKLKQFEVIVNGFRHEFGLKTSALESWSNKIAKQIQKLEEDEVKKRLWSELQAAIKYRRRRQSKKFFRKWRLLGRKKRFAAILIQSKQRSILARKELAKRKVLREAEEDEMYLQSIIDARYRHLIEQKKMSLQ